MERKKPVKKSKKKWVEFYVGLFVIVGVLCSGYLLISLGDLDIGGNKTYRINAYFSNVAGLKNGATVEMAGVEIGRVISVNLDTKKLLARVIMGIHKEVVLAEDAIASVKTSGIIGDKYISLSPGGSDMILEDGDILFNTESAIDIESLVSKYIFNKDPE
ncbi:outer membrane lipid asymmetry maintenance protein MlaD [Desulfocicer vacuolatum]|uniref:outer membrane lipid asymmetry maintenance protein MlaD n=1 Tax=Desulfocicer vacuolatum TaxID=2298 RepID=UPI000A04E8F7|nr:outer membrane lipid asymmetry maintenance protein MlaD [Desulfocicer vacuolatum]